ncbi:hypothetical protein ACFLZI_03705 [Nitrospirota bacterium]
MEALKTYSISATSYTMSSGWGRFKARQPKAYFSYSEACATKKMPRIRAHGVRALMNTTKFTLCILITLFISAGVSFATPPDRQQVLEALDTFSVQHNEQYGQYTDQQRDQYYNDNYVPALASLQHHVCTNRDSVLIKQFFQVTLRTYEVMDNARTVALAGMYRCEPEQVMTEYKNIHDPEALEILSECPWHRGIRGVTNG